VKGTLTRTPMPAPAQRPHDRPLHGPVMAGDVGCSAAIGELHPDPQKLCGERVAPLADHRPVAPEDVGAGISLASKVVVRDGGARVDLELKPLRVGIQVRD
jgi:hypothetical protein